MKLLAIVPQQQSLQSFPERQSLAIRDISQQIIITAMIDRSRSQAQPLYSTPWGRQRTKQMISTSSNRRLKWMSTLYLLKSWQQDTVQISRLV
ncbi:hypothetical protein KIN20_001947 [Parelaphostrongylus tenuis]|uniref:Uncharacterized protein n=1 Tax=Parelaphostrongylus tenuis TaxID=148309 RepID=A0AAD5MG37_PARTN|nr:hypothetical protein KIN20_001947 [Parelaphostrongylus tenuis]